MDPKLKDSFEKLEESRQALFAELTELDNDSLNRHPEGKWSILQILHHLIQAESLSLSYIRKKMQYVGSEKKSGLPEAFRLWLLSFFLKLPFRFKAPGKTSEVPASSTLDETRKRYEEVRRDMHYLLESIDPAIAEKRIFKHPVAGKMNLHQALTFMGQHFKRHMDQIRRLEASMRASGEAG